ncbi:MAG: hypothetical protein Q9207_003420 [Kuettlingeria erythrocarpa]
MAGQIKDLQARLQKEQLRSAEFEKRESASSAGKQKSDAVERALKAQEKTTGTLLEQILTTILGSQSKTSADEIQDLQTRLEAAEELNANMGRREVDNTAEEKSLAAREKALEAQQTAAQAAQDKALETQETAAKKVFEQFITDTLEKQATATANESENLRRQLNEARQEIAAMKRREEEARRKASEPFDSVSSRVDGLGVDALHLTSLNGISSDTIDKVKETVEKVSRLIEDDWEVGFRPEEQTMLTNCSEQTEKLTATVTELKPAVAAMSGRIMSASTKRPSDVSSEGSASAPKRPRRDAGLQDPHEGSSR